MLSSFGEELGLERELAFRVAGAFGGGMARMGETCGAVTGALMVIGLKYGMTQAKDEGAREKTYKLAQEFMTRFKDRHNSMVCKELLGYDLSTPEERKAAYEKGLFTTLCPQLVRDAVEIVEQLL
ncbi:MAG: C-GCAxxG-C-C family protein [Deltaproteobacteria bacterium]|nr:C-GCAxxG-C-C family protein [Deltaproteobacteria bacterium]